MRIPVNPLAKYSLLGREEELRRMAVDQVPVLGNLALKGQATVFYAAPNTGKTLITLSLIVDAIRDGRVRAEQVYYINVDDTVQGLLDKQAVADEFGFHLLSEGWCDFTVVTFLSELNEIIESDTAQGVIIILDTLKKFTNLMDKGKTSHFAKFVRRFVLKGGTLIALAHTNKNPGMDGKPRYSGTTDIVDDFDCAYTMVAVSQDADSGEKVVEFENFKRRGNVVAKTAYAYAIESGVSYHELLLSVRSVDELELVPMKKAGQEKADAEIIDAVTACITNRIDTKMKLAKSAAELAGVSHRIALKIIERYTGDDPAMHKWRFEVRERGAKVYVLLDPSPGNLSAG